MALARIVPYDANWPREFVAVAADIRRALGPLALRIDHIGSTAVPRLAAKDVIDVQVSVAALDPEAALVEPLRAAGFVPHTINRDHRPPGRDGPAADWAKRLMVEGPGQRRLNLHLRVDGRPNQRYSLLFRDYLRAHTEAATSYATLKRRLAHLSLDTDVYADIKDPATDLIMVAAEEWAGRTGWHPGPSDG
ncbi:MAG: GrpB family protein [Chloroflexi bacterium]|nr:MAG: GrpB family protein [Chloroflexota bacterium]